MHEQRLRLKLSSPEIGVMTCTSRAWKLCVLRCNQASCHCLVLPSVRVAEAQAPPNAAMLSVLIWRNALALIIVRPKWSVRRPALF